MTQLERADWQAEIEPSADHVDETIECVCTISIAISLKRVADTLDKINRALDRMA
jgi:hypothetical protein